MTSIMLYIEHMNTTINLHVSVQANIRFITSAFFLVAFAAAKLDLASPALLPNETGVTCFARRNDMVKSTLNDRVHSRSPACDTQLS